MNTNIFTDPQGYRAFHDIITDRRLAVKVHQDYLTLKGETIQSGVSYPHFCVMLRNGQIPLCSLRPLADAMRMNNIDPEPAMMTLYADCITPTEHLDGDIENEFCTLVQKLGKIAETVRAGIPLSELARQDSTTLNQVIGEMSAACRHMAHEILAASVEVAA